MRQATFAIVVVGLGLLTTASARASDPRADVDRAAAALGAEPPRREEARAKLGEAIASGGDPAVTAEAHYLLGRLDEDALAFPEALAEDRAALAMAPDTRWAVRAGERADWLRARSEGDFAPLVELERLRHDPVASSDPAAIDALARDADGFPRGMVRVEAWMLVSEAWLGRMPRPDAAIAELKKVVIEPRVDPLTGRLAEQELVDALASQGRIDEAVAEASLHSSRLDPKFLARVGRLRRRHVIAQGARALLVAFVGMALLSLARAWRRGALAAAWRATRSLAPSIGAFVAVVALVGGALARSYESGSAGPFLLLAAAAAPVALLSRAWSAVGSDAKGARVARALLSGGAALAAAFVLLETLSARYLDGFGL